MTITLWFIIIGSLFIFMALSASVVKRLPLTTSMLYLLAGVGIGPVGLALLSLDPMEQPTLLEHITELAVLISLFTAGLKLRIPLSDHLWRLPVLLAFGSMGITVGLITLVGTAGLGLPLGAAVLLGAILAPTDPVLASDVQVENPWDQDELRFSLTGEAGLNDGTAFPFVMLGLGLLGLHEIGMFGWRWLAVDVVWATLGGLAIGALCGRLVAHLVLYLRRAHKEAVGLDDFLALGLMALAYGVALLAHTYGFLSVFAAGLALRHVEMRYTGGKPGEEIQAMTSAGAAEEIATDAEKAPAYMTQVVLGFNEQLERIAELGVVVLIGAMLATQPLLPAALWFVPLLFFVIRPLSVWPGLAACRVATMQRWLMCWFGIRGISSIYYLAYAIAHGLVPELAQRLTALTLTVVAVSVVVHGISVTPLMKLYSNKVERRRTAVSSK